MSFSSKFLPALCLLACAVAVTPVCDASAQGFASISSLPTPGVANSAGSPAVTTAAPAQALPPAAAPAAGVQTVAALGFSSISGATPSLPPPEAAGAASSASGSSSVGLVDKVLVDKSDRRLYLLSQGRVIAEYPVRLGLYPYGHKQREGDFRTPEGKYTLVRRNPDSDYFLSIQVSYPNREDAAVAKESGYAPGGLIMIHGQPNVPKRSPEYYATRDWTDGCIALSNADMADVWRRTSLGLPIEIRP